MCDVCAAVGYDIHDDGFRVNATTTGDQTSPNIARYADGGFAIVYQSSDTPGNGIDIRARWFNGNGATPSTDVLINQTTAGNQTAPAILVNSNGTLSLLWQTPDLLSPGNTQLMMRSFDHALNPLGAERQVSTSGADGSYTFTQRPNGTIFIAYENNGDIYGRTLDSSWNPLTAEVQLNTTTTGTQTQSRLVTLSNGNILVAFQSNDNADGGGGSGDLIRNRVFSTSGDAWTPVSINGGTNDFVVNTTAAEGQTSERLSRLVDGRILEVWQSGDFGDGSGSTIRARIIGANGDPTGAAADFIVNTITIANQSRPQIIAFEDGRRLIYWHSFDAGNDTIRGRFVHANGSLDASDFVIASLADVFLPTFTLTLLANQQVEFNYQGLFSSDFGEGILGSIGTPANLNASSSVFINTGTSPYDIVLQSFSTDQAAAQISRGNAPWNDALGSSHALTYSYRATSAGVSYSNGAAGFTQFNAAEIAAAEAAIQLWEDVAGITLTRVQDPGSQYSDAGQLLLWNYASATPGSQADNASGFGGATNSGTWHHFVYLNDDRTKVTAPTFGNDGFRLFLHEIGHALGLAHPGSYNILPGGATLAYDGNATYREDTDQYTVMSYFDESITHGNFVDTFAMTPMLHDIAALQRLYGANTTTRAGDSVYGFNSNAGRSSYLITSAFQQAVFAVWDGGGTDTLDFSGYAQHQTITLVAEKFSSVGGLEFNVAIAAGTVIENAIGGSGWDTITGNAANNILSGGAGNDRLFGAGGRDTLVGGPGGDTFIFGAEALADGQAATPIFDRVTDYDASKGVPAEDDYVDVSALAATAYNHGSGQAVTALVRTVAAGTGTNVQVDPDGTANGANWTTIARLDGVKFRNAVNVVVDSTASFRFTSQPLPANTFDGDRFGDILWQNDNGQPGVWLMNGANPGTQAAVGSNPGPSWKVAGGGDFDGDGKADILWQNDNGQPGVWLMDGVTPKVATAVGSNPGPSWKIAATADFNGDGKSDILWQNDNGQPGIWLMDGLTPTAATTVGANPGPSWKVVGAGDFNGDGKADILWQNDNGQPGIWLMDGITPTVTTPVGSNADPSWKIVGTGDFDGNGKSDILWQNDNGQPGIWLMDGLAPTFTTAVGSNPGTFWKVVGATDVDGDGKSDILWQNDDGQPGVWLMNGTTPGFQGAFGTNPGPAWHMVHQHDGLS